MRFDDYELLVTLDKEKTLRQAAEKLYISQPAVSQRLKTIENYWGVQIFIRTKKELIKTSAGEKIIEHAKQIVETEGLLKENILINKNQVEGKLTIGVASLLGYLIMPDLLRKFLKEYPNVNVQLEVGSSSKIIENVDRYHLAIIRGNKILNLENELLFTDEHYLVAPKNRSLEDEPLIEFQADPWYINQMKQFFETRFNEPYNPQIYVDQIITCRELLLKGVGMTVLPSIITDTMDLTQFHTEKVEVDNIPLLRSTYVSYDNQMLELPQVKTFLKLLEDEYK